MPQPPVIAALQAPPVPVFALYGEHTPDIDLEFVHIELIETRSRFYDWEIDVHTHRGLFQVLFILTGAVDADIDGERIEREAPIALIIPQAVPHGFRFSAETHGYVMTVAEALLFKSNATTGTSQLRDLLTAPRAVPLDSLHQHTERIESLLAQIMTEAAWPMPGHTLMLDWLVHCVLMLLARQHAESVVLARSQRRDTEYFVRFRTLLETYFDQHWGVGDYAAQLHLTETRLTRLCEALTGKSAFALIQDRVLMEARRRLLYIVAPVSRIAFELGFEDPAYFCRFFKRHTGMTPSQFRARAPGETTL
jgi:AraC family transcriptional regulator, transcriptional activator of pobA